MSPAGGQQKRPAPRQGYGPKNERRIAADPFDTGVVLCVAVRRLRQRQLDRRDVQEKLRQIAERLEVAR